jgi:cellobiose-specific phosphotransferase system component IIC
MVANSEPDRSIKAIRRADADAVWPLLGSIGLAFALVGVVDITLAWFPSAFGSAAWEFGTIGATLNGLPLPALGLMLVLAGGMARASRWQVRAASIAFTVLTIAIVAVALIYVTVVPVALADVTNGAVRTGLMKSIIKALVLLALYPALFGWGAHRGFRWLSAK